MSLINHWPLQTELRDIVGGNDGSVGAGVLTFAPVAAGIQSPVFDGTFWISLTSPIVTDADADYTVFIRFASDTTPVPLFGIDAGFTPTIRVHTDTLLAFRLVTADEGTEIVSALGTGEHSVMLVHLANDTVNLYLDGALLGNTATQDGTLNIDAIGKRSTQFHDGQLWDVRHFDSDESANAAAIHADVPVDIFRSQSLANYIPFNDFGF